MCVSAPLYLKVHLLQGFEEVRLGKGRDLESAVGQDVDRRTRLDREADLVGIHSPANGAATHAHHDPLAPLSSTSPRSPGLLLVPHRPHERDVQVCRRDVHPLFSRLLLGQVRGRYLGIGLDVKTLVARALRLS